MESDCFKEFTKESCLQNLSSLKHVICSRSFFFMVGLGQLLSVLLCGTAVTSGLLQRESIDIPTGQSFFTYVLLSITFTSWMCWSIGGNGIPSLIKNRGWKYFLLALIDVEANFLVIKAYQYTTVTSVQLLDCFSIPTVLVLSWRFLGVRFRCTHIVGVVACLAGAFSLVLADHLTDNNGSDGSSGSNNLLGDVLVLGGAVLYGISNVGQEMIVSEHGTLEYLGCYSFLGSFISGVQFAILERDQLQSIPITAAVVLPFVGFTACLYLFVVFMSYAMLKIGAMAVNLNLLSSDFFALLVGLFVFQYKFHVLYFVSFFVIIIGLVVYNLRPPVDKVVTPVNGDEEQEQVNDNTETTQIAAAFDESAHVAVTMDTAENNEVRDQINTFFDCGKVNETSDSTAQKFEKKECI